MIFQSGGASARDNILLTIKELYSTIMTNFE